MYIVFQDVELNGRKIKENFNDVVIGQFTTKDQDATDSHIYTLVDNAGGRFVIKNDRLFTSQTANLDYESQLEYNITVQSNDDGIPPLFVDETYVIMVLDANEPPSLIEISNLQVMMIHVACHVLSRVF